MQKAFRFGNSSSSSGSADSITATGPGDLSQMAGPMLDFAWWFNNTVRRVMMALLVAFCSSQCHRRGDDAVGPLIACAFSSLSGTRLVWP